MLHEFLKKHGIYYVKRRYLPRGFDWLWDIRRLNVNGNSPVVFDIGANEGSSTSGILRCYPRATVHAFEPVSRAFEVYASKFAGNANVRCSQLAVSDSCGSATILVGSDSQWSHLVSEAAVNGSVESVEKLSVDSYCERNKIAHIDVFKTDTEGHDWEVIKGAEAVLRAEGIDWILVEVSFDCTDRTHSQFDAISSLLKRHGMKVWCFYDHCFMADTQRHLFCNVLFVRGSMSLA